MWFTPLYDREDFQNFAKSNEATVLKLSETTHKVLVTRCIAGILNLDAYEPASGRLNPGDRTGFRMFTDTLKMLCTLGDDTDDENAFTKEKCNILYDNVTGGEGCLQGCCGGGAREASETERVEVVDEADPEEDGE
jgi:hypothetical protein